MPRTPAPSLEHVNITVQDIPATLDFLHAAVPAWQVRGRGTMDWFGKPIAWVHVGTDDHYLALQGGGEGEELDWQSHRTGTKHIGIVVPSVDAVVERLERAGHPIDHWGGAHAFRRSAYFICRGSVQFEFVEYLSEVAAERNAYGR